MAEARLGLWAIPGAAVIMCGRAHFGAGHALESPRYTTVAILLLIASLQLSFAFVPWNVHEGWRGFTALPPRCSWR